MAGTGVINIKLLFYLSILCAGAYCTQIAENDIFGTGLCGTRPAYRPHLRIHGGSEARSGYWPWIGSMQFRNLDGHFCGCTLLNEEWVVTAAHCVVDYRKIINDITLFFGINNVKTLEPAAHRVERSIAAVIINPNSVEVSDIRNNDIALLRLSSPIKFTDHVRPACLATHQDELEKYRNCWVAGWGGLGTVGEFDASLVEEEDKFPDILQQVEMPLISKETCASDEYRWKSILSNDMICAGDEPDISTCSGDSGGPLVCQDKNNVWNLVGIVSWGRGLCSIEDPSVFCRVSWFVNYTKTAVAQNEECGLEIVLQPNDTTTLTSLGYPLHYDDYLYCFWTVIAPEGQRVYVNFRDFKLQRDDYVYIGTDLDNPKTVQYTGEQTPPDIVSPERVLYVTFESDSGNSDKGFSLAISSTNETTDFTLCKNAIEILSADKICDGTPNCFDRSDEQLCPQCEPIPAQVSCGSLPYSLTYYPDSSKEHALAIWAEKYDQLSTCHDDALLLLCNKLFPPCPDEENKWTPCKHLCKAVNNDCSQILGFGECDSLPDEAGETFCSFNDGDIFGTGVCGTRPAYNPWQRIHGGQDATRGSWPWIGSIQLSSEDFLGSSVHVCGCTLLNEKWAVTSIDCVNVLADKIKDADVVFGTISQSSFDTSGHRITRKVARAIVNPDWTHIADLSIMRNNVALIQLSEPVKFNDYVRPACLATSFDETNQYRNCMVAGWGETGDIWDVYGVGSHTLKEVSVPLISPEKCGSDEFEYGWIVSDDMICTESGILQQGHCAGDTGGPLVCQDTDNVWQLVGVVSFGGACDGKERPSVYSRVSWLIDFIKTGVSTGNVLCRSDQFRCANGQCIPSVWARCNVTEECGDGSDEQGCSYCPEKSMSLSLNSTLRLQSVGYPNNYANELSCKWTVTPAASNRRVQVQFIDLGLQFSDYLYIGTEGKPRTVKYTDTSIPKLRVLSAAGEALLLEFETTFDFDFGEFSSDDKEGFSLLFSDVMDGEYTFCSNGLEILHARFSGNDKGECYDSGSHTPDSGSHEVVACGSNQFRCNNGEKCIPENKYCDRISHCSDHSDEIDCVIFCDSYTHQYFECGSGECLHFSEKCNDYNDCLDGSDEKNCDFNSGTTGGIVGGIVGGVVLMVVIPLRLYIRYRKRAIPRQLLI